MVEMACIKASKEKGFYSENHTKVFSAIQRFEELYLDELAELLEINQRQAREILDDLISRKMVKKTDFKYHLTEPFESSNTFLFEK